MTILTSPKLQRVALNFDHVRIGITWSPNQFFSLLTCDNNRTFDPIPFDSEGQYKDMISGERA